MSKQKASLSFPKALAHSWLGTPSSLFAIVNRTALEVSLYSVDSE